MSDVLDGPVDGDEVADGRAEAVGPVELVVQPLRFRSEVSDLAAVLSGSLPLRVPLHRVPVVPVPLLGRVKWL